MFNARDELGDKIDKLTAMMGKLTTKDSNDKRPFKPQIYKSRGSYPQGQNRTYNQRNYQNRGRLGSRSDSRRGDSMEIIDPDFSKATEGTIFKEMLRHMEDKIIEENTGISNLMVDQEKIFSQEIMAIIGIEAQVTVDQIQDQELVLVERIRCYNCREYDHFARDCPTSREEQDLEQLQQMLNLEAEEQTHWLTSRQNSPIENYRTSPLNL